jgi:hypothetical protein
MHSCPPHHQQCEYSVTWYQVGCHLVSHAQMLTGALQAEHMWMQVQHQGGDDPGLSTAWLTREVC